MKKSITKKLLTIVLVSCLALCCFGLIMTNSSSVRAATDVNNVTVSVAESAEIKSSTPSGIRFTASISKADYEGLAETYDTVECGIIIAPKNYVGSATMTVDGWKVDGTGDDVVKYDGGEIVPDTKYFQTSTVIPKLDSETNVYTFVGAFVDIGDANLDREFIVRAYVATKNDGDAKLTYNYSNTSNRSVYSVAANALVFESELNSSDLEFVKGVTQKVNTANAEVDYTFTVKNLTEGKEQTDPLKNGDTFKVVASYTNTFGDIIEVATVIDNEKITDNGNGTYTPNNNGYEFDFDAVIKGVTTDIKKQLHVNGVEYLGTKTLLDDTDFKKVGDSTYSIAEPTMAVAIENIPAVAEGKTVYAVNFSVPTDDAKYNGVNYERKHNKIQLENENIKEGTYFTFKYYNDNTFLKLMDGGAVVYGNSGLGADGYKEMGETWGSGALIKHFDENGNYVISTGTDGIKALRGQWLTVEIYFPKGLTDNCSVGIMPSGWQHSGDVTVYMTDMTVSDYSVVNVYKEMEITTNSGTGADGAFNPGDEIKITSASVGVKGQEGRVTLDASKLVITSTPANAVAVVGGKYIYQGTGDFTINCSYWNVSDSVAATGIVGKYIPYEDLSSSFVRKEGLATLTKVIVEEGDTTSTAYKAVSTNPINGQDVYLAKGFSGAGNEFYFGGESNSSAFTGKYLIFSTYIHTANQYSGAAWYAASCYINYDTKQIDNYTGKFIVKNYNQDGELVNPIDDNLAGQWITTEIYVEKDSSYNGMFQMYNQYSSFYVTGVYVSADPLYPAA